MKSLFLLIFFTIFSPNSFSRNCPEQINLGIDTLQALVSISEETVESTTYKKVSDHEVIFVPNLTQEIFQTIKQDPQKIAEIFGAKLLEEKSSNEFRLAIPILGFDLSFDVTTKDINDTSMSIEINNFNTFFHSGSATLNVVSFDEKGATLSVKGHALVPKTAANMFSFSVGGEKNFKKLLQSEVDNQLQEAINRFEKIY